VPVLHTAAHEKKVSWLELFYDLIFVAAFIQLGNGLAEHVTLQRAAVFAGLFVPLWIAWAGFTFYANRFSVDDFTHRLIVFGAMFAVGAMAVAAPRVLDGEPTMFALCYAGQQAIIALLNLRAWRQVPAARSYAAYWALRFGAGSGLWLISAFVPTPYCYFLWAVGVLVILWSPASKQSRALQEELPIDMQHLSERFGLLTIIVLGESFVKVLSTLATSRADWYTVVQACSTLLITCCIWWIYFDDVAGSRVRKKRFSWVLWLYAHLPLQLAVTATGVAIKKAVHFDLDLTAPEPYRWLLSGTLALTFFSVGIIDSVTERRDAELSDRARVNVRYGSAVMMLLTAPAGAAMPALWYLVLIATMCVAQVVFDMMMAPLDHGSGEDESTSTSEIARMIAAGETIASKARPTVGQAIRKGTPSELRHDLYFWFMDGSWGRFFGALVFLYVVLNVFFAGLYILQPGCISGADPASFADAFYFSVQTLSTIGYGAMSPETTYGDIVVTAEAAVGLLSVALATGLLFSKASLPKSGVLFSKVLTLTKRHGVPTLSFRAGNARGNEVVDANVTVSVLKDDISPEGEHLRRLHDVPLVRSRTPLFALTWAVMHEIDDASPFENCSLDATDSPILAIIVTLMGHDGTYGQTIYARHIYYADDIREGERFVDVISQLPDGRMMIDYARFHDTVPAG
jgi:inward rectifier potassium channel